MEIHDWMTNTKAGDVMVKKVVTLKPDDLLADAAATLLQNQISGAPVLDEFGACQGILSVSDVVHAEEEVAEEVEEIANSSFWNSNLALPPSVYAGKLAELRDKTAPAAGRPVSRFMTTNLVTVDEDNSLETVVRYMVDAHVHRVLVVSEGRCLRGLISMTDVLAALMRADATQVS